MKITPTKKYTQCIPFIPLLSLNLNYMILFCLYNSQFSLFLSSFATRDNTKSLEHYPKFHFHLDQWVDTTCRDRYSLSLEHIEMDYEVLSFYPSPLSLSDGSFYKGNLESHSCHVYNFERNWKLQDLNINDWKLIINWCGPFKLGETEGGLV